MAANDIELRRLVIKAYHMNEVTMGDTNKITTGGVMTLTKDGLDELAAKYSEVIEKIDIEIIAPGDHDRYTNTIMDIIPISVKVLGKCGEGITHTITGVYVMPTGVDTEGKQAHEFGSSEGNLKDMLYLNRAGTRLYHLLQHHIQERNGAGEIRDHRCIQDDRRVDERVQSTAQEIRRYEVH